MQELNPGFDGTVTPLIDGGVTKLGFATDDVTDISPVRALVGLQVLKCAGSGDGKGKLADLSPIKGMSLLSLEFNGTRVFDLSPLQGMNLTTILFTPKNITKGLDVIRRMKSLTSIGVGWGDKVQFPPDEFWRKYDAGDFGKPISDFNSPAFQAWVKTVAALPAEQQVEAVAKKLQELNPGFDGKETHKIESGAVTELHIATDAMADISPVRALGALKVLTVHGGKLADLSALRGIHLTSLGCWYSQIADLSPLAGMPLTDLSCFDAQISDLSPLRGMPLTSLNLGATKVNDLSPLIGMRLTALNFNYDPVSDLAPLRGMPLTILSCSGTKLADLSPLKGMPLTSLACDDTQVSDLTPLGEMNLAELYLTPKNITKGIDMIRQMKSLTTIGIPGKYKSSPDEFWKKYDAGEFGKPDSAAANPNHKPITTYNDPAFQQWMKTVAALPAEQQVEAIAKKLVELNPGFDGKVTGSDGNGTPKTENGVVTELRFVTDNVTDISPMRALKELKILRCTGSNDGKGKLSDLSPLTGMKLTELNCGWSQVADLSPLKEMKLTHLSCYGSQVADLSPLQGMSLTYLQCGSTQVSNLSPLKEMPLTYLGCGNTKVFDLTPLKGMPLGFLCCQSTQVSDLTPLRGMPVNRLECSNTNVGDLSPLKGMPLWVLWCDSTPVIELSPLKGMPLIELSICETRVSDLSPLQGMGLKDICFVPKSIPKGLEIIRQMRSLKSIGNEWDKKYKFTPAEFWKKYDAGEFDKPDSTPATQDHKPIATFDDPAFKQWMQEVANLRAEKQLDAVAKKMQDLNSGFDGKMTGIGGSQTPKIENGVVTEIRFVTDNVTDISPVRALVGLKCLNCNGSWYRKGKLSDLSPLNGMKLTGLGLGGTQVSDLSPLKGMPLTYLHCDFTQVSDLSPLNGMPLTHLNCGNTHVSDLSPLKGMPLTYVHCGYTQVSDLSPLQGMLLTDVDCGHSLVFNLAPLQGMPLTRLWCGETAVSDLSPLQGMRLTELHCDKSSVSDLSPLKGMPLTELACYLAKVTDVSPLEGMDLTTFEFTPEDIIKGMDVIRRMKSLSTIGISWGDKWPPAEFWKKYDAGEFNN